MKEYRGWLILKPSEGDFAGMPIGVGARSLLEARQQWQQLKANEVALKSIIYSQPWLTTTHGVLTFLESPDPNADPSSMLEGMVFTSDDVEEVSKELAERELIDGINLMEAVERLEFTLIPKEQF